MPEKKKRDRPDKRTGKPVGRPKGPAFKDQIDLVKLMQYRQVGLKDKALAYLLGISESTLDNYKRNWSEFHESYEKGEATAQHNLVAKAYQMAMSGDRVMLIFVLKNRCGWRDIPVEEPTVEREQPAIIGASDGRVVSIATGETVESTTAAG